MKEKFRRFMQGRYGSDELSKAILVGVLICLVIGLFTKGTFRSVVNVASWILIFYSYYRMFSRNYGKRWAENQKYLSFKNRILGNVNRQKKMMEQRKTHHIYTCSNCKQKIRIPKGKGKIEITCPKCRNKFIKRS